MSLAISVITCAHNPRPQYLEQVIGALRRQTLDKAQWEYQLIDNASDEPLAPRVDLSWHPNAKHVSESKLGLTNARLRGISEANGEILVFVDDDNVLDADYLEQALRVANQHSMIGAWGGQRHPVFEATPPVWIRRHWSHLALGEFEHDSWGNLAHLSNTMPTGAGLCVRKIVADFYADLHANGKRNFLLDRTGASLVSGGDVDLASCACDIGLGVGLFAALELKHLIPAERLSEDYLLRLAEGIGYSSVMLESFRPSASPAPSGLPRRLADFLSLLLIDAHERRIVRAYRKGEARARQDLSVGTRTGSAAPPQSFSVTANLPKA